MVYSILHRSIEIICTIIFFIFAPFLLFKFLLNAPFDYRFIIITPFIFIVTMLLADFISGLSHYLFDSKGHVKTPIWGPIIKPFRDHHIDPQEMTRHDFVETNGHNMLGGNIFLFLIYFLLPNQLTWITASVIFLCYLTVIVLAFTNQIHKWAHSEKVPWIVKKLQDNHLFLSKTHHAIHHETHSRYYCITVGWNDMWLDKTRFFEKVFCFS